MSKQLQRLFQLRFLEGVTDREILARELGVSRETIRVYLHRILKHVDVTPPVTSTVEESIERRKDFICPECLRMMVKIVGVMRVCQRCGLELGRWELDESLPFDTTYAPTASMALGKSLGGTLPSNQTHQVLLMAPSGRRDVFLRSRHINILHETNESPTVKRLIEYGSNLLKNIRLEENYVLGDIYGNQLRALGSYLEAQRLRRIHRFAHALLGQLLDAYPLKGVGKAAGRLKYGDIESEIVDRWMELNELIRTMREDEYDWAAPVLDGSRADVSSPVTRLESTLDPFTDPYQLEDGDEKGFGDGS